MTVDQALIAIIDSDDSLRARLRILLEAAGLKIELFKSAEEYLRKQVSFTQLHRARRAVARHKRSRFSVQTSKDRTQNTLSVSYRSERGKDVRSGDESWGHRVSYQTFSR